MEIFFSAGTLMIPTSRASHCGQNPATWSEEVMGHWDNAARTVVEAVLAQATLGEDVLRCLTCFSSFTSWSRSELCPACGLGTGTHLCQISPPPRSDLWSKANLLTGTLNTLSSEENLETVVHNGKGMSLGALYLPM